MHLHVVAEVGPGGEASVAEAAAERLLLGVDAEVADERRGRPEGLPTVGAAVAFGLGVDAPVVLEEEQVGEGLVAEAAEEAAALVEVLVADERAGVAVGAAALATAEHLAAARGTRI